MKTKYIVKGLIATLLLAFAISGCESYNEPLLEGIGASREFSPLGITTAIRTQTTVELNWITKEEADHYVVEFSADDPDFNIIYKTVQVTAKQLPVQVQLEGETTYSIRVKAVSASGLADSKWSVTTATTLSEQIFLTSIDGDIDAKQATLRWIANSNVTQIVVNPGNITHVITAEEKTSGIAIIKGLTPETDYTATLFNGTKKRGILPFKTGIDIGTGILVRPTDDLSIKIAEAASGAVLVLMPGDYTVFKGALNINKPITIRGLYNYQKPLLHVNILLGAGSTSLNLIDLDMNGDTTMADAVKYNDASTSYGSLLISGCNIHDYSKSLIYSTAAATKIASVIVENSVVTNVLTSNGDFLDFRAAHIAELILRSSTFNNCATSRDFIRVDAPSGVSNTGLTTNILIDGCTIYNKSMLASNRIFYVRFLTNVLTVRNTLFETPLALYANQSGTSTPTFSNNNYWNSAALYTTAATPVRFDNSGSLGTLNPQFANAAAGDFTVKNQTIIDKKVGDPRWIK